MSIQFTPSSSALWIVSIEASSTCGPQPNSQPPPPIAQAPYPTRVISRPVLPSSVVLSSVPCIARSSSAVSGPIRYASFRILSRGRGEGRSGCALGLGPGQERALMPVVVGRDRQVLGVCPARRVPGQRPALRGCYEAASRSPRPKGRGRPRGSRGPSRSPRRRPRCRGRLPSRRVAAGRHRLPGR